MTTTQSQINRIEKCPKCKSKTQQKLIVEHGTRYENTHKVADKCENCGWKKIRGDEE